MKLMLVRDRNVLNTNWLIYFANLLVERGHEIIIACDTYRKLGKSAPGFILNKKVRLINLNGKTDSAIVNVYRKIRGKLLPSWRRFDALIKQEKPDAIICYFPVDLYNVTSHQNHLIPIIQMVHGYPPRVLNKAISPNPLIRANRQKCFAQVSAFQVLMDSFKGTIDAFFKPKKVVRIANPVKQFNDDEIADLTQEKKKIIYVARIEKEIKRPHLLVEAFAQIAHDFPDWKVEIWGLRKYPSYDKEITDFIKAHHLEQQVALMGYSENVEELYRNADIHAFPSCSEGFSLAIADGMALGLPYVGFKDALSVNEIIVDGHNGFLATDVNDFAQKLKTLMLDKNLRLTFGKNAREDMKAYAPELIIDQWEALLKDVIK